MEIWIRGKNVDYLECKNKSPSLKKSRMILGLYNQKIIDKKKQERQGTQWRVLNTMMTASLQPLVIYSDITLLFIVKLEYFMKTI